MHILGRWLLLFVFTMTQTVSLYALTLTDEEATYLKEHPVIRVSNELNYAPFDFVEGQQPKGYSIDLLNLLASKVGLNIEYINGYTWGQLQQKFKNGELDLLHTVGKTKERERYGLFSNRYHTIQTYVISPKKKTKYRSIEDLYDKVVAVGSGWAIEEYLALTHPRIRLLTLSSLTEIVDAVHQGDADAMMLDSDTINHFQKSKKAHDIKYDFILEDFDNYIGNGYYLMAQPDAEPLISILNKAMDSLSRTEWQALDQQWLYNINDFPDTDLTTKETVYLQKKRQITVCIDPNWMPYESFDRNGKHIGMTADYFALFEKNYPVDFAILQTKTWSESIEMAKKRQCDLFSLAMKTPERSTYMNFTSPYLRIPLVIATKIDIPFITSIDELNGQYVGIPKGYAYAEFIRESHPLIKIIDVKDIDEGLEKVARGELFAYIGTLASIGYKLQSNYLGELKITGKLENKWELGIGVRNDDPMLLGIMEKMVESVTDEQSAGILNKWISVRYEKGIDYTLIWQIVFVAAFFLITFFDWNRRLVRTKKELEKANQEIEEQNIKLEKLANIDKLTQIYNRTKLDEILQNEYNRAMRYENSFGVAIVDLDYFKNINDSYGHQMGDKVLLNIASVLRDSIRQTDYVGRWGGEEFMIIYPHMTEQDVFKLMESIRIKIASERVDGIHVTASIGSAVFHEGESLTDLVKRADMALYKAKENGRDQVVVEA